MRQFCRSSSAIGLLIIPASLLSPDHREAAEAALVTQIFGTIYKTVEKLHWVTYMAVKGTKRGMATTEK